MVNEVAAPLATGSWRTCQTALMMMESDEAAQGALSKPRVSTSGAPNNLDHLSWNGTGTALLGSVVMKANAGVKKHGIRAKILNNIVS